MLKDEQDAYGHLLMAHHRGEKVMEIVERDDGFIDVSEGPNTYFAPFEAWPRHQQEAMPYVHGRVVDVGCGAGRVSLYLQRRGHDVLGIDNSPLALEVCRERGVKRLGGLPATQLSRRLGVFDTVVMMGNNFGLLGNPRRARWMLRKFRNMTSPEGRIVAETRDVYQTENPDHLAYHARNRRRGRMPGQVRIRVRYRGYATPYFDYLMVSKEEMEEILRGTVWRAERYLDSDRWEGVYVAVLQKE